MAKKFNITGRCFPAEHYMADVSMQLKQTLDLVEQGAYFIINRPRQYGKTTTLFTIARLLREKGDYIVFTISFASIGDSPFVSEEAFCPIFIQQLAENAERHFPEISDWLAEQAPQVKNLKLLFKIITTLTEKTDKKIVVTIDEVDKSSNNQLFVSFLAMLRDKYLERDELKTFHSVVLAGVHDVKSLKIKLRPNEEAKLNSPWNIAAEYKVDLNLKAFQIKPMLEEYCRDKNIVMDTEGVAERLFYWTSGYPFLVSKLCKMMDEEVLPTKNERNWTIEDLDLTAFRLTREVNTNFESLIKNLNDYPSLYTLVKEILVESDYKDLSIMNTDVSLGIMHGILRNGQGVWIHNRIYEEVIYHYMVTETRLSIMPVTAAKQLPITYRLPNGGLDFALVLSKFQTFMKEQFSKNDSEFIERNGRLIFLAFLRPIINGSGYDFKEVQISEERRLDVVITYFEHRYVVEMKMWYGKEAHTKGIKQLTDYLDRQNLSEGYLIVFDTRKTRTWKKGWTKPEGKRVYTIWV